MQSLRRRIYTLRGYLKNVRTNKNLSQQEIATKLDISLSYYNQIENGERQKDLDLSMATKLAKIFDVSIDWIIAEEEKLK